MSASPFASLRVCVEGGVGVMTKVQFDSAKTDKVLVMKTKTKTNYFLFVTRLVAIGVIGVPNCGGCGASK